MAPEEDRDESSAKEERSSADFEKRDLEKGGPAIEELEEANGMSLKAEYDDSKNELERPLSRGSSRKHAHRFGQEKYPETDLDKGLVGWDGQDDPENPRNFSAFMRWYLLGLISVVTFISPLASSMFAPGVSFMDAEFHNTSAILSACTVSIFILGYAFGPLFLSPLSEIYGRRPVLDYSNLFFAVWNLGCALCPNLTSLLIMRFLGGIGGSACITIGGGVISDLFLAEQRGLASALYSLGPLFGPVIGPICGGFIAQRAGWRWVFWVLLIVSAIMTIGIIITNRETNHAVLIQRKTERLRKELNRPELQSVYAHQQSAVTPSRRTILRRGVMRPLKLLFTSPIVFLLSLYLSFVFGLLYLLFTTITPVYIQTYGWRPELCGLAYLGIGIGFFLGIVIVARTSDKTAIRLTKANSGIYEPEMRLPTCVFYGMLVPISFFWYGWAVDKHVHWVVPIIALMPYGIGLMGIIIPIQTYLIDAFPKYAASAFAALVVFRCSFGAMLPLAGPAMYDTLGLGWGNSLLGFIALALIPAPALIYRFGGGIRKKYPVKLD
ncbi:MFS general substrate transporter [Lepidopterella palustris CBS 459.81]|uniref:MFS general substrate transporter n=1 Tax=Lepidopterella palustris CBS 459.81 TaxID=1314670 RepID=A0A8E2E374_9PEZI|nr:MFS general substrate transporter [Lepidopterella palustris CBS 459.81]